MTPEEHMLSKLVEGTLGICPSCETDLRETNIQVSRTHCVETYTIYCTSFETKDGKTYNSVEYGDEQSHSTEDTETLYICPICNNVLDYEEVIEPMLEYYSD